MTHDDILKAARERIAEIDKQTAAMAEERGKLQALLGAPVTLPVLPVAPWPYPPPPWDRVWPWDHAWPLPGVTWTLGSGTIATSTTTVPIYTSDAPGGATLGVFPLHDTAGAIVVGGEQRPGSGVHFTS